MPRPADAFPTDSCFCSPGLRMPSPSQTCSPLRLSSLPTAIGVRGIQRTIPSYPGRLIFVGQRSQRRSCYGLLMGKPPLRPCAMPAAGHPPGHHETAAGRPLGHHETAAGRSLSTMRRPQGFLSGRLSGVGAKEPLWLPTGDQERFVSEPLCLSEKMVWV